jgi:hypothetical protein
MFDAIAVEKIHYVREALWTLNKESKLQLNFLV